ncbi:transposase [Pseudomonas cavernae]|uniref:Transposase n=1 Tax=Pseudomonas cavernae TaxID=2320867 RepID=A0A385Z8U5_9PSED|nr:MaoC family dehydratase N-terminal domain-containing protein [Pseudomonas cavernae]AYC34088.1 transposase [Pseudomonas cavernae]
MSEADYSAWLGRTEETHDELCATLVRRIATTFDEASPAVGQALPPLWHWAFFQEPVPESGLGADGHPARGGFLPAADNRNRMWAGSEVEFLEPLRVGGRTVRQTRIEKIEEKSGRTGALLFVSLRHEYVQDGRLTLRERQDIVYREPTPPKLGGGEPAAAGDWNETVVPTPTLLFRYSAVTFNGHRIHYDWPYVTEAEGYTGLVVHGPLIATLMLRAFCRANPDARVRRFSHRGQRPLIAPQPFQVSGRIVRAGVVELWAGNDSGIAQIGEVHFD